MKLSKQYQNSKITINVLLGAVLYDNLPASSDLIASGDPFTKQNKLGVVELKPELLGGDCGVYLHMTKIHCIQKKS